VLAAEKMALEYHSERVHLQQRCLQFSIGTLFHRNRWTTHSEITSDSANGDTLMMITLTNEQYGVHVKSRACEDT